MFFQTSYNKPALHFFLFEDQDNNEKWGYSTNEEPASN